MTATVRSTGANNSGAATATTFSPTMPAGFVAGDLLIGIATNSSGTAPATRPSGSTLITNTADGTVFNLDVVRKVAVGSDVFTWTIGTAQKWAGCVIAVTAGSYDPTTPVAGAVGVAQGTTATLSFVTSSSTPSNTDSLIICAFGQQGAATWQCNSTTPSMVELADTTSTGTTPASCAAYRSATPPAASSLTRTGTATLSSANACMFMLFVNPGPVATAGYIRRGSSQRRR